MVSVSIRGMRKCRSARLAQQYALVAEHKINGVRANLRPLITHTLRKGVSDELDNRDYYIYLSDMVTRSIYESWGRI